MKSEKLIVIFFTILALFTVVMMIVKNFNFSLIEWLVIISIVLIIIIIFLLYGKRIINVLRGNGIAYVGIILAFVGMILLLSRVMGWI